MLQCSYFGSEFEASSDKFTLWLFYKCHSVSGWSSISNFRLFSSKVSFLQKLSLDKIIPLYDSQIWIWRQFGAKGLILIGKVEKPQKSGRSERKCLSRFYVSFGVSSSLYSFVKKWHGFVLDRNSGSRDLGRLARNPSNARRWLFPTWFIRRCSV